MNKRTASKQKYRRQRRATERRAGIVELRARILEAYDRFNDDDISTERLLQMTADECSTDVGEVTDALLQRHLASGGKLL